MNWAWELRAIGDFSFLGGKGIMWFLGFRLCWLVQAYQLVICYCIPKSRCLSFELIFKIGLSINLIFENATSWDLVLIQILILMCKYSSHFWKYIIIQNFDNGFKKFRSFNQHIDCLNILFIYLFIWFFSTLKNMLKVINKISN